MLNNYLIGDNIQKLKKIPDGYIDMIYMDPPYATGRNFFDFNDKFKSMSFFIDEFLQPRFKEMYRVLKKDGNIIVHVEPKISHYVKICLDNIFGIKNFKNEIIWSSGGNKTSKKQMARFHDVLLVYGKSNKSKYYPQFIPYTKEYLNKLKWCDIHSDYYSTTAAHNAQPEVNPRPNLVYEFNGHTKQWYLSKEKMEKYKKENRLFFTNNGIPRIKRFLKELKGKPISDLWTDINQIQSGEKLSYATQKPIKLLERLIMLYTKEGDLVLDPFAGSGTVGRASINLNRKYLLIDINDNGKKVFMDSIWLNKKHTEEYKAVYRFFKEIMEEFLNNHGYNDTGIHDILLTVDYHKNIKGFIALKYQDEYIWTGTKDGIIMCLEDYKKECSHNLEWKILV